MKKLIFSLICLIGVWGCSDIAENERFVYEKPAEVNRNVLLEDYTGQRCVNCPPAADEIHKLKELYGDSHVVAVAIHGGPLAVKTNSKVLGLRNELADMYYNAANIEANPMGVINRAGSGMTPDQWQDAVSKAIQQTAPVDISAQASIENGKIKVDVRVFAVDGRTSGKLQVWVVENGIVAMQSMPDGSNNPEYVHNHVLRAAVNGDWGEDISLTEGNAKDFKYEVSIEEAWNPENLALVAFVYNNFGVQQVEYFMP